MTVHLKTQVIQKIIVSKFEKYCNFLKYYSLLTIWEFDIMHPNSTQLPVSTYPLTPAMPLTKEN